MAKTAAPPYGVYTPLVTFFNDDESLDLESTKAHATRMAQGGVSGLVLQGSNGEAPHLLHDERQTLIKTIREHLDSENFHTVVIIAGCGAPSVRETVLHLAEAKAAGANFGLVLPPSYWTAAMTVPVIEGFFTEVAARSALPFLIYNFPGVTSGIDISSDSIIRLAQSNPGKIVGVKLTCGNLGKLQRVSSTMPPESFSALAGKSDFYLPALVAGSQGVIAALANVVPKMHVRMLELYAAGDIKAAIDYQNKLSHADWALLKVGVAGVKAIVASYFGSGGSGKGRLPLGTCKVASIDSAVLKQIEVVIEIEQGL